jgi:predicted amidohydrolase YtcJ
MRKTSLVAVLLLISAVIAYALQATAPSVVLVNGRVYTLDPARPWAEAVAIAGSRITAVGTTAEIRALATSATRVIDLKGAFAVPGFNDAHVHIDSTGALLVGVNLLDVHEPGAFTARIREAAGGSRAANGAPTSSGRRGRRADRPPSRRDPLRRRAISSTR